MKFEEAEKFLNETVRSELRDHAFGDREVTWVKGDNIVATGYFGGGQSEVYIKDQGEDRKAFTFYDDEAMLLSNCGTEGSIERNDETGPDEFVQDDVLPGLTLKGVYKELTGGEL